jgi:exosortase
MVWERRRKLADFEFQPLPALGWITLLAGLALMFLGRVLEILFVDVLSEIPVIVGCVLLIGGPKLLKVLWFPIAFLFFSAPPPAWLLDAGTVPLKTLVSNLVTQLLYVAGYPIAQNGVMIMIGSYQLLVKDACAGMNSIFALSAIGVFYSYYISDGSLLRKMALLVAIIPITIAANFLRVLALVLIAYYGGIDAVEGPLHETTGILLFVVALLLVFVLDQLLAFSERFLRRWKGAKAYFAR